MEVEEETTSNHVEDLRAPETTTLNNESLLENTTSIDKQSENELSNLVTKSNSLEEEDSSVLLPKSEDSEAVLEKVEEVVVHCRDSESVAALSGGFENSVVVESMNVVQDSKDGDDAAIKEIDVPSDDVAAVECGGSELTSSIKADGEEAVVERNDDPELVPEKVENDGDDSNVGESSAIEKDENEGNDTVEAELKPEDEKETVKEEEAADVLKVGDEGVVLPSPVVHNDGGDDMTDQSKNDGDLNVPSEDVENVQGIVSSDVRDDGDADVQVENIDNLQGDEAMADIVKEEDIVPEEPVVAEIAKEEDIVPEEPIVTEIAKEEDIVPEEPIVAETVKEEDIVPEEPVVAEIVKEEDIVPEEPVVAEICKEEDTVPDEDEAVGVKEDLKEESLMANKETVDGVAENEEETMVEDEDKSLDTEMETDEKSLDTDIDTEKSLDIEMETEKSLDAEVETEEEANLADEEKVQEEEVESEPELPESSKKGSAGKRKRGGKVSKTSKKTMEEDVCFICFDGGDLVLCDRRNCPKAYHPSCVNRDEAFFQSKGSWNCGWHLCSICEKKAEYMCYTCTYSSCRSCIKTSVLLSIRDKEKKGLCEACMRTVMLIEKPENQENANFEDENSWEHLFKDYWTETKERYNLSLEELSQAKKHSDIKDDTNLGSDTPPENPRTRKSKRQTKKQKYDAISDSPTNWVSKDLLEFITHMKNGDSSVISQYEIQDLLLEYIKRNKLRDPNKKSQIICDARLENLFGKPRVAHIEMLKLLESHFLGKEDSLVDDVQGSVVDDGESYEKEVKDKKRKGKKKGEKKGPQLNREDYASIDIHNISLIYMRRKLVEDLLDDMEVFRDKIVGTFVRIRISGANQKQDIYRLVQVTGTSKAGQYTLGKRTTSTMLEILNLDKTEIIPIDTISNQEFTEEECKRLRQSIKCGLINRLTVGDILDKAMELQEARVNDWLETETVRLNHLRDRASDMGRFKELKECVEKLRLLKEPEERARRLEEFPLVHDDPTMDPEYESEEDTNSDDRRRESYKRLDSFRFNKRGRDQFSPRGKDNFSPRGKDQFSPRARDNFSPRGDYTSNSKESWSRQNSGKNYEYTRNLSNKNLHIKPDDATSSFEMHTESPRDSKRAPFVQQPIKSEKPNITTNIQPPVTESTPKVNDSDKIWHYKDPSGKIQGPFSMGQLRKWSKNGYFPAHLKIWKKSEKEDDGILLNDALEGNFQNVASNKLPSPTPQSKSSTGQSPTPNPNPNPSLIPCVNKDANVSGTSVVSVSNVAVNTVQGGQVAPQMVQAVSGQDPHGWTGGPPQVNPAVNMQPMVYNQWAGGPAMVQDASGNFVQQPMAGPQQFPFVNQKIPQQQQQPNVNWGTMGMNPNMVYPGMTWPMVQGPQVTATMDPNWVGSVAGWVQQPPVPGVVPNQTYPGGWVGPVAGWGAPVQGNVNAGWSQGAPGTANMGWVAPPGTQSQVVATPTPTPTPTLPTPIPAPIPIPIPTATPTQTGNSSNQGNWGGRNQQQGNWGGNEQQQNRGGYSGQRRNRGSSFQGNNNNSNNNNNNNRRPPYNKQDSFNNKEGGRSGDSSARSSDR